MAIQLFNRLETLDRLISIKSTGRPPCLARRLGISERALYNFLDVMRALGAPIYYCKKRESYCYREKGRFHIRFNRLCLHTDDEFIIDGLEEAILYEPVAVLCNTALSELPDIPAKIDAIDINR